MVEGMEGIVVTVSGYHGTDRMKVIKLISLAGANYVGKMSRSITHLVCWKFKGEKYELAKKFGALVVNHQWLDDCIKEGKRIPESMYTLQSGQEVGFNIENLPVQRRTTGILCENELFVNKSNILDCLDDVVDLVSDEIENDDWEDDLLLDENGFPGPHSRKASRQRSKRKLVKETCKKDPQGKANMRTAVHELGKPAVAGLQRRDKAISIGADNAESSRRSRRLVKKNARRHIIEIDTIDNAQQQNRTHSDFSEHIVASSLPNDLLTVIGASMSRSPEPISAGNCESRDEVNVMNDVNSPLDPGLHVDDAMNAKGRNTVKTSPDVLNSDGNKLGNDQSKVKASSEVSCVICWTEFSSIRGVLPCGHRFCFSCIQNWADRMATNRKESTCPLCKASFASITRVDDAASLDQKIYSQSIPCPASTQDIFIVPEGRAFLSNIQDTPLPVCCQCQNRDPADLLIPCHICENSCIHHYCLDPPMTPWICHYCRGHRYLFRT